MMHDKRADFQSRRRLSLQNVTFAADPELEPTADSTPTKAAPDLGEKETDPVQRSCSAVLQQTSTPPS